MAEKKPRHISSQPLTWANWFRHVNWLNTFFVVIIPISGFIGAYFVPLHPSTALFALFYYFNTGLGITAGKLLEASPAGSPPPHNKIPPPRG